MEARVDSIEWEHSESVHERKIGARSWGHPCIGEKHRRGTSQKQQPETRGRGLGAFGVRESREPVQGGELTECLRPEKCLWASAPEKRPLGRAVSGNPGERNELKGVRIYTGKSQWRKESLKMW